MHYSSSPVRHRALLHLVLILLAVTFTRQAPADVAAAETALSKGDVATAFRHYEILARLGNPLAQYKAGVMLLKGQGVPQSVIDGTAWLLAARDGGQPIDGIALDEIVAALPADQAESARALAEHHRNAAAALIPPAPAAPPAPNETDHRARLGKGKAIDKAFQDFGDAANAQHVRIGWVVVRVLADPEGHTRDAWVIETAPDAAFGVAAVEVARRFTYEPALSHGHPVADSFSLMMTHATDDVSLQNVTFKREFEARARAAAAGDTEARLTVSRLVTVFHKLFTGSDQMHAWMTDLAQQPAQARAMYFISGTPRAEGMPKDTAEERRQWKLRAARAGFAPAQFELALESWSSGSQEGLEHAHQWLEAGAFEGYAPSMKYLAGFLLSPAVPERNPARVAALVEPLLEDASYKNDVDTWQIAAAASAALGQFENAVERQNQAIKLASRCTCASARVPDLQARLGRLQKHEVANEELLLIPAGGRD